MIRRILEFCHWSQRCSPRRPGRLVVTATIAALNLLTGGNSSRPRRLWNPKQRTLWGVERLSQAPGTWVGGTKLQQLFLTLLITFFFFFTHCCFTVLIQLHALPLCALAAFLTKLFLPQTDCVYMDISIQVVIRFLSILFFWFVHINTMSQI